MRIAIINGPNLNLLGQREPETYGRESLFDLQDMISARFPDADFHFYQSNVEGDLIDELQTLDKKVEGIVLNAGGYTHTSVALSDCIAAIETPVIEVHLSNVYAREEYRHISLLAKHCRGVISGFGFESYILAVLQFLNDGDKQ